MAVLTRKHRTAGRASVETNYRRLSCHRHPTCYRLVSMVNPLNRTKRLTLAAVIAAVLTLPASASMQAWPEVFDPFTLRTMNLTIAPADWDTIRFDLTNE